MLFRQRSFLKLVFSTALVFGASSAHAAAVVRDCRFEAASVRDLGIPHYGFLGSTVEMKEVSKGSYKGSVSLAGGHSLEIRASLSGNRLSLATRVRAGDAVMMKAAGVATVHSGRRLQRFGLAMKDAFIETLMAKNPELQNPLDAENFPEGETHYKRFTVSCLVDTDPSIVSELLRKL